MSKSILEQYCDAFEKVYDEDSDVLMDGVMKSPDLVLALTQLVKKMDEPTDDSQKSLDLLNEFKEAMTKLRDTEGKSIELDEKQQVAYDELKPELLKIVLVDGPHSKLDIAKIVLLEYSAFLTQLNRTKAEALWLQVQRLKSLAGLLTA